MQSFDSIGPALEYVAREFIANDHAYIVNVRGPNHSEDPDGVDIQVAAQHLFVQDGELGFTIEFPFEPDSEEHREFETAFADSPTIELEVVEIENTPTQLMKIGPDPAIATRVVEHLLEHVLAYDESTPIECEVADQGLVDDEPAFMIERVEMGTGWVCFQSGDSPPDESVLPSILNDAMTQWLQRNPEFKIRATLPIVERRNTIAIHIWFD